ncbi:MAG: hypothetical protein BAJALOKI3v1_50063 [Promethearchaeota archaeon]|nr:MAG: hypothetical protein BAJALOKI3v1_50063 [Candidatus Lokiarchaeota archaeon]
MRITNHINKTFGILGLPNSGTSIVCNIFNSFENGFCISEPLRSLDSSLCHLRFDKLTGSIPPVYSSIIPTINKLVKHSKKFKIGGLKETLQLNNCKYSNELIHNRLIDIIIFVFRDPLYHFNSICKQDVANKPTIRDYNKEYIRLIEQYDKSRAIKPTYFLKYEELCEKKERYFCEFCGDMKMEYDDFTIKPTNYEMGHKIANKSIEIKYSNNDVSYITEQDKDGLLYDLGCYYHNDLYNHKSYIPFG